MYVTCKHRTFPSWYHMSNPLSLFFMYSYQKDERFIENLLNAKKFCISCGEHYCESCRDNYGPFAENIVGVHQFPEPEILPSMIENPESFLPQKIPPVNVLIAINLHNDILTCLPEFCHQHGISTVIVPVEIGELVPKGLEQQISDDFDQYTIEYSFPRPFCALKRSSRFFGINKFIEYFQVGYPQMEFSVQNNILTECKIIQTAPCGNTFYICQELVRNRSRISRRLKELISKAHHAYPCNASMKEDIILGDTTLHIAGYIHREAIYSAILDRNHSLKAKQLINLKNELEELRLNSLAKLDKS